MATTARTVPMTTRTATGSSCASRKAAVLPTVRRRATPFQRVELSPVAPYAFEPHEGHGDRQECAFTTPRNRPTSNQSRERLAWIHRSCRSQPDCWLRGVSYAWR
jgi:hypothetical protein